jgi:type-F conjugative transfer system pilin assembly protein TrbC
MKKRLLFLLLASSLLANDSEIFKEKQQNRIKDIDINLPQNDKKNFNITNLENAKSESESINIKLNKDKANIDDIKSLIESKDFKKNLENTRKAIINDKDMIYQKMNVSNIENTSNRVIINKEEIISKPKYLDEPIIIFISSSMDKEMIKNYFRTFKKENQEVEFVLNGLLPNTGTKIMPTINYIKDLLGKDYIFNIDINPLKFQEYNIDKVPAIAYKNYVHIGAVAPTQALESIYNKDKIANESLKKLLDNL